MMATAVSVSDPRVQAALKVDDEGRLLVAVKGGGGGGNVNLSAYETREQAEAKYALKSQALVQGAVITTEVTKNPQIVPSENGLMSKKDVEELLARAQYPKILGIVRYTNGTCGAINAQQSYLFPLATLVQENMGDVRLVWPEMRARANYTVYFPVKGTYQVQLIPDKASTTPVYLYDGQQSFTGILGPSEVSRAQPIGTGMTFIVGVNSPKDVRFPLTGTGTSRQALPDMSITVTYLGPVTP